MAAPPPPTRPPVPNARFAQIASDAQIATAKKRLEANGFRVIVARSSDEARKAFHDVVPEGAEVFAATSPTLESLGITDEVETSGRYRSVRTRLAEVAKSGDRVELRRLGQSPDWIAGSVHAITEDGEALIASRTGSQLGPYAYGAGNVLWIVGAQKIVPTLTDGLQRIRDYAFPLEDARALQAYGVHSGVSKLLVVAGEIQAGRITIVLVHAEVGF
ncbi:MAG: LUD domain-containing protein [Thermoplasmata archaeon]